MEIFNSPSFLAELLLGKYSRWAGRLDTGTLTAMLLAVGEFASRYSEMKNLDGTYPAPIFHSSVGAEFRMVCALEGLASIFANKRPESYLGPCGGFSLSPLKPAFSSVFSSHLAQNQLTTWAQGLDEERLALIIWNIGEYGCRSRRYPPTFDEPQSQTRRMRAALKYLWIIYAKVSRA